VENKTVEQLLPLHPVAARRDLRAVAFQFRSQGLASRRCAARSSAPR
jgi:hypothetical protein